MIFNNLAKMNREQEYRDMLEKEAIVIGRNYSTSLGVIRALGANGFKVSVLRLYRYQKDTHSPEIESKYVSKSVQTNIDDQDGIIDALLDNFASDHKKLVIPADDLIAALLDQNYERLERFFFLPLAGGKPGELTNFMDKGLQKEIAQRCGLDVAKGVTIELDEYGNYSIPNAIIFPCYAKPQVSVGSPKSYIKKCETEEELEMLLDEVSKYGKNKILVEEYLNINKEYVIPGVSFDGNTIIPGYIEKIKIGSGKHKGVTEKGIVVRNSINTALLTGLTKLVKETQLNGLFDIEVIYSNGKYYFNELNLRYGAAGYAITVSGVNLPAMYAEYRADGIIPKKWFLNEGKVFISEKVALEDYKAGYSSWTEYKRDIKNAEIHFIKSFDDPKPFKAFKRIERKTKLYVIREQILRKWRQKVYREQ